MVQRLANFQNVAYPESFTSSSKNPFTVSSVPENQKKSDSLGQVIGSSLVQLGKTLPNMNAPINTGENVTSESKNTNSIDTGENVATSYTSSQYMINNQQTQDVSKELVNALVETNNKLKANVETSVEEDTGKTIRLKQLMNGEEQLVDITKDAEGNYIATPNKIQSDKGAINYLGGQKWTVPRDSYTWSRIASALGGYAANYDNYDTKQKWLAGGQTLQNVLQSLAGTTVDEYGVPRNNKTALDSTYISNFVDAVDMTYNWKNRNDFQNAMSGANTVTNFIRNMGLESYVGGTEGLNQISDGLALLNFGNSVYQLQQNWGKMNSGERTAATTQTILAGIQAYGQGKALAQSLFSGANTMATNAVATNTAVTNTAVTNTAAQATAGETVTSTSGEGMLGQVGQTAGWVATAYMTYNALATSLNDWGQTPSADKRKRDSLNYTAAGASIGTMLCPGWGTAIGTAIGAITGLLTGSINAGKSKEQVARDTWRDQYKQVGVFKTSDRGEHCMRLADGSWYSVGQDGRHAFATYSDGTQKTWADPAQFTRDDGSVRTMKPYDVDFTNNLDYGASVLLTGLKLPVGGSVAAEESAEVPQMLGYMTNGVTGNCVGRELNLNNFNIMASNVKSLYADIGITSKKNMVDSAAWAYMQGKLTTTDYHNMLLSSKVLFDDTGFDVLNNTLQAVGRETNITPANSGENK